MHCIFIFFQHWTIVISCVSGFEWCERVYVCLCMVWQAIRMTQTHINYAGNLASSWALRKITVSQCYLLDRKEIRVHCVFLTKFQCATFRRCNCISWNKKIPFKSNLRTPKQSEPNRTDSRQIQENDDLSRLCLVFIYNCACGLFRSDLTRVGGLLVGW